MSADQLTRQPPVTDVVVEGKPRQPVDGLAVVPGEEARPLPVLLRVRLHNVLQILAVETVQRVRNLTTDYGFTCNNYHY